MRLSREAADGRIQGNIKLYNLYGEGDAFEKHPGRVLECTFPDQALRLSLSQARLKLSGEDPRGVIVFSGSYGSGKSHHQLALYHLLGNPGAARSWLARHGLGTGIGGVPGEILGEKGAVEDGERTGFQLPETCRVVALDTRYHDYERLWEPVFRGLGREDLLPSVGGYPTVALIREAVGDDPAAIFIDELERWFGSIPRRESARREANKFFIQNLCEVASEERFPLLVFLSLLRENREVTDVIDRTDPVVFNLTLSADKVEVLLFRLFATVDGGRAEAIVDRYLEHYALAGVDVGDREAYRREMLRTYPLHPELLRALIDRYCAAENYQNTRGLLYLLASAVQEAAPCKDLLCLGDLGVERHEAEFTRLDRRLVENCISDVRRNRDVPLAREILQTVLVFSFKPGEGTGASERDVLFGTLKPGVNPNDVQLALAGLRGKAWYLHEINGRFSVGREENLFAMLHRGAEEVPESRAVSHLAHLLHREVFGGKVYVQGFYDPPDDRRLKAVCTLAPLSESQLASFFHGVQYRNRLILLCPRSGNVGADPALLDQARRIIVAREMEEGVGGGQAGRLAETIERETRELVERLRQRYGIWYRFTGDGVRPVPVKPDLRWLRARVVSDDRTVESKILEETGKAGFRGIRFRVLRENFYLLLDYPVIADDDQLNRVVRGLCAGGRLFPEVLTGTDSSENISDRVEPFTVLYHRDFVEAAEEEGTSSGNLSGEGERFRAGGEPFSLTVRGRHPQVLLHQLETSLGPADIIARLTIRIAGDLAGGAGDSGWSQILQVLGMDGMRTGSAEVKLEMDAPGGRDELFSMLRRLPPCPGGMELALEGMKFGDGSASFREGRKGISRTR